MRLGLRGDRGQVAEQVSPERSAIGIVIHTGAGDVREDAFAFFHHSEFGESSRVDRGRTGELGGAADGGGFVGIFATEQ
jgi:hypothetical protein